MSSAGESVSPLDHPWYESVYREIRDYPACRELEVGCGRGGFAIWLSKNVPQFQITALDFSGAAIDIARTKAVAEGSSVKFVQGDAQALPFENDTFDLVISCECMEHVPDPRKMACELARVLKPGGRLALTTPSQLNGMLIGWLHSWLTRRPYNSGAGVQPHENFYFFWTVHRYLRLAELEVDRMESSTFQWLLLPRVDPAKLCTRKFKSAWAKALAFPFGLQFSFFARKPCPTNP
jgi:demethylmenaquinone methyltransferase/2-methoxy-6-polyprenyl-1,4-benzoquinol methylase